VQQAIAGNGGGIVDQDIDRPALFDGRGYIAGRSHVAGTRGKSLARKRGRFGVQPGIDIQPRDTGSLRYKSDCDRAADSLGGARDQYFLSAEFVHGRLKITLYDLVSHSLFGLS
jgi:hypothetical protein